MTTDPATIERLRDSFNVSVEINEWEYFDSEMRKNAASLLSDASRVSELERQLAVAVGALRWYANEDNYATPCYCQSNPRAHAPNEPCVFRDSVVQKDDGPPSPRQDRRREEVKKWSISFNMTASKYLGEVEADTYDDAIAKAEEVFAGEAYTPSICNQCSRKVELGDGKVEAYEL